MSEYRAPSKSKRQPRSCARTLGYIILGSLACGCFLVAVLVILGPEISNFIFSTRIVYVEAERSIDVQAVDVSYQLPEVPAHGGIFSNDFYFQVDSQTVELSISNNLADVNHTLTLSNIGNDAIEGVFIVPLPTEAALATLIVSIDGVTTSVTAYRVAEGRERLQTLAYENNDFSLLAFVDKPFVEVPLFPLIGSHTISVQYQHELSRINGLLELDIPLSFPATVNRPIETFSLNLAASNDLPVRNIYPASMDLSISQSAPNSFTASASSLNYISPQNLALYYAATEADFVANLLSYRENTQEDAYFLLLVEAPILPAEQIVPQDVILVLDQSGSMSGIKWKQAQDAASFVLQNLNPQDRFFVTTFSSSYANFANSLAPASEAQAAIDWVYGRSIEGGTNINAALLQSLSHSDSERPTTLIFMTDGEATEGETNNQAILTNLRGTVAANVRIFVFGVGNSVNTSLLDGIAQEFRGQTVYVRENETIDAEISRLYEQISSPVLTNISFDFGDAVAGDFVPSAALPDLYGGQQMILLGRYRLGGETMSISLSGNAGGENQTYRFENLSFQNERGGQAFVMQLWAARGIGEMLNRVRLGDENPELVDSIISQSLQYGILTPYTEFLIGQDDVLSATGQELANSQMRRNILDLQSNQTGASAVDTADLLNNLSSSRNASSVSTQGYGSISSGIISSAFFSEQRVTITATPLAPLDQNGVLIRIIQAGEILPTEYVLSLNQAAFERLMSTLPEIANLERPSDLPVLISNLLNAYGLERGIEIYNQAFGSYLPLVPSEAALIDGAYRIAPAPLRFEPALQTIREKIFILQNEIFVDTRYKPDTMQTTRINFGSAEYGSLIATNPELLPYLSLGLPVIIVWDESAYEIVSE